MEENLIKLVKENLPELAANEFAKFFKQSEQNKRDLDSSQDLIEAYRDDLKEMTDANNSLFKENNQLKEAMLDWETRAKDIEKREKDFFVLSHKHVVQLLEKDVYCAQIQTQQVIDLVKLVFNNVAVRESITKNIPVKNDPMYVGQSPNGNSMYKDAGEHIETHTDTVTTTKE